MSEELLHSRLKVLKHGLINGAKCSNLRKFADDIDEVIERLFETDAPVVIPEPEDDDIDND